MSAKMSATIIVTLLSLVLIGLIPNLGLSIASFIIAGQNTNFPQGSNVTCDGLISLPTWLFVNAAVLMSLSVVIFVVIALLLITFLTLLKTENTKVAAIMSVLTIFHIGTILIYSCFLIAWNVIGSIALFRDSMDCFHKGLPVTSMVLASLIFQWLSLVTNWCTCCGRTKNSD
jgi:hypothetical protein